MFQFPHLGSQWRSASHRVCWNLGSVHPRKQPKPICGPMGFLWIPALLRRLWVALRQLPLLLLGYRFILWGDKGLVSLYSENHKGHLPVWSILILCQPMSNHPQKQLVLGKYLKVFLVDPFLGIIYICLLSALHLPTGTFRLERKNRVENAASSALMSEPHTLPHLLRFSTAILVYCCHSAFIYCPLYLAPNGMIACFLPYLCVPSIYYFDFNACDPKFWG